MKNSKKKQVENSTQFALKEIMQMEEKRLKREEEAAIFAARQEEVKRQQLLLEAEEKTRMDEARKEKERIEKEKEEQRARQKAAIEEKKALLQAEYEAKAKIELEREAHELRLASLQSKATVPLWIRVSLVATMLTGVIATIVLYTVITTDYKNKIENINREFAATSAKLTYDKTKVEDNLNTQKQETEKLTKKLEKTSDKIVSLETLVETMKTETKTKKPTRPTRPNRPSRPANGGGINDSGIILSDNPREGIDISKW